MPRITIWLSRYFSDFLEPVTGDVIDDAGGDDAFGDGLMMRDATPHDYRPDDSMMS